MQLLKKFVSTKPIRLGWRCLDRAGPHYLALTCAGLFGLQWPSPSVQESTLSPVAFWFWLGSLIIGGTLCSVGRWFDKPGIGVAGLALVLVDILTFILALSVKWPESASSVCFMISVFSMFGYRLYHKVKTRDARTAIRRGNPTRSDLATYALDRLAGSRSNRGGDSGGTESFGTTSREESDRPPC